MRKLGNQPASNIPTLARLATLKLDQRGLSAGLVAKLDPKSRFVLNHCLRSFHFEQLCQAVIDGQYHMVEQLLAADPTLALLWPTDEAVIQSQLTWQCFKLKPVLVLALLSKQVRMVRWLVEHMMSLSDGVENALSQWELAERLTQQALQRSKCFDFQGLVDAINADPDCQASALVAFRGSLLSGVGLGDDYYDISQLLLRALTVAETIFRKPIYRFYSTHVVGFLQSLLAREDAEAWCAGLYEVVTHHAPIADRAKALRFLHDSQFYRSNSKATHGMGFDYYRKTLIHGNEIPAKRYWQSYCQKKQGELQNIHRQLQLAVESEAKLSATRPVGSR